MSDKVLLARMLAADRIECTACRVQSCSMVGAMAHQVYLHGRRLEEMEVGDVGLQEKRSQTMER